MDHIPATEVRLRTKRNIGPSPNHVGYGGPKGSISIRYNSDTRSPIRIEISETHFPFQGIRGEAFEYEGQKYRILNIGNRGKLEDRQIIDEAFEKATHNDSYRNFDIVSIGHRARGYEFISNFQNKIETMVYGVYRKKKGFLQSHDFTQIRLFDKVAPNFDLYVLIKDPGIATEKMTAKQFENSALMTIRVAYNKSLNPESPSIINRTLEFRQGLPHELRSQTEENIQYIWGKLDDENIPIAELTRYVKFQEVAKPLRDAMLYRVFSSARDPENPVKFFIGSADQEIREKVMKPWRFRTLAPFQTGQEQTPEFIMFLDTETKEFSHTLDDLHTSSKMVIKK